ncbi:Extracellular metalloprotease 1 [Beauveria bassiana]|nr:Extracellular metalloprotease 1 [Beauveria bassiana]KAH8716621.1 Extracellular metalloprotease 1 [Beauveria bassiana]
MGFRSFGFAIAIAAIQAATAHGSGCAVDSSDAELMGSFGIVSNVSIVSRQEPMNTYRVFAHNVYDAKTAEGGFLSEDTIEKHITTLNDQLNRYGFVFTLNKEDIRYTEAQGIAAAKNRKQHEYLVSTLRQGNFDDLNIFYLKRIWEERPRSGGASLGLATHPQAGQPEMDGIFLWSESVTGEDTDSIHKVLGSGLPESAPATAAHEFGHWLGLFHTNEGGCKGHVDPDSGELYINDTNLEKPSEGFAAIFEERTEDLCKPEYGACDKAKPVMIHNFMSTRPCMQNEFTNGQVEKMRRWAKFRAFLKNRSVAKKPRLNKLCTPFRGDLKTCIGAMKKCNEQYKDENEVTKCVHAAAMPKEPNDKPPAKPEEPNDKPAESAPGYESGKTPNNTADISKDSICKPFGGNKANCSRAAFKSEKQVGLVDRVRLGEA